MNDLILVTGSEGLVGSRFLEISESKNNFHTPTQIEMDITKPSEIKAILASYDFKAIIHFAAYTDVSAAEKERGNKNGDCWLVNVEGTRNLAEAVKASEKKIHFVHISTDMVFSGSKRDRGPYREDHKPERDLSKLTWYGYTKAEAEREVLNILGEQVSILRIIYPVRASYEARLDYIRLPLSLHDRNELYPLFSDQHISISFIDEVCNAIDVIIKRNLYGIYHASTTDTTTPYELISLVIEKTRGEKNKVKSIKLDEYLRKNNIPEYRYPRYGGLKVEDSETKLDFKFSTYKQVIDKLVAQGLGK
ncbi:hypothetical protein A2863_03840 [Candidatus Woesebacteria bacterium RIFCSPHIGHO2_01_FULL_38_9b]|uniref:dTDP-4-dehydrorhamnose reductase n=1 Tax=Candidatus Woesebacteria bacterium RIFCSPHIGHO2_01_FULL_38_9b TaxID=1802493 RepID=A0A1F7Y525_9BACT|nr:MAG: hypothetical protein A2863_03840 [Candidatus Woesebacteria bacterium RIFCSPHIGHO2_01_FULL_38_9b]